MAEAADEDDILELAAEAVSTLTGCSVEGIYVGDGQWRRTMTPFDGLALRAYLQDHMATLGRMGEAVDIPARPWAWAYPMYSTSGSVGFAVISAAESPHVHDQYQLRLLAQQTGLALTNLRLRLRERRTAAEQAALNARLEETVGALRRGMEIHERLTEAVASGVGVEGITRVVHELTGLPVIIEDRAGHQRAMPAGERRRSLLCRSASVENGYWATPWNVGVPSGTRAAGLPWPGPERKYSGLWSCSTPTAARGRRSWWLWSTARPSWRSS